MKVTRRISETTTVEAEGDTVTEVFEALARLEAVFTVEECGLCHGVDIRHDVQADKENHTYYKAVCRTCGGEFRFGLKTGGKGILFPQLKFGGGPARNHPKEGQLKPNGGWSKRTPNEQDEPEEPAALAAPSPLLSKALAILTPAARKGSAALKLAWEALSPEMKNVARGDMDDLIAEARRNS